MNVNRLIRAVRDEDDAVKEEEPSLSSFPCLLDDLAAVEAGKKRE